jgi:hypothetical protein
MSKAKSGTVIPAADVQRQKQQLAGCEARIETGLKSFADVGAALAEIRDSQLYVITHKTFEDYVAARWDMSRTRAYGCIDAAAVVSQIWDKNMPPPAIESHAAALAAAPEHLRGQVWAKVREATGGKPTARAVTAAVVSVTAAWEALEPVTAEEKAVHARAYEAARPAGGGAPAYIAAGREAVAAYRREHGVPAAEPADHTPNGSSAGEDGKSANRQTSVNVPAPVQQPGQQVLDTVKTGGTVTGITGTAAAGAAAKPDSGPQACGHDAAWHEQADWLFALAARKGLAWDGRQFAPPQRSVAGKHAGHRLTTNDKNTKAFCENCKEWFDTAAVSA